MLQNLPFVKPGGDYNWIVPNEDTAVLQKELEYRRKKQWDIFSWCSAILVSINGGIVALATQQKPHVWLLWQRGAVSVAVLTIMAYEVL